MTIAEILISFGLNNDTITHKPKIKLDVINDDKQHFLVTFERPGRMELSVHAGTVVAHVYDGTEIDPEQEPLFAFDGFLTINNNCEK